MSRARHQTFAAGRRVLMFSAMTRFAAPLAAPIVALSLVVTPMATPVSAQDSDEGFSLMEEGAKLFFRGLMSEIEPTLDELESTMREMQPVMQDFLREMGPALKDILTKVEDWSVYHPPEMLPNGDIIIRRKTPLTHEEAAPDNSEIEL